MSTYAVECPKCRTLVLFEIPEDPGEWKIIVCPDCNSFLELGDSAQAGTYYSRVERIA